MNMILCFLSAIKHKGLILCTFDTYVNKCSTVFEHSEMFE